MSQTISGVYSDARSEYTRELCTILVPSYFKFYLDLLAKAKEGQEPKKFLWNFQTLLNDIPEWNMEKVSHETAQLLTSSGCDYMEDLLTGVLLAHTKVLLAIQHSSRKKKVQITVPKVEHFLFKVLCETSKLLWGSTFLFREDVSSLDKQQNYRSVETLLGEGILQAVRAMVPLKNILKDLVTQGEGGDEEEEEVEAKKEEAEPEVKEPEVKKEEVKELEVKESDVKKEEVKELEVKKEEVKEPQAKEPQAKEPQVHPVIAAMARLPSDEPPQIVVDTTRSVGFSDYKTMFDSDNPDQSDIVRDTLEDSDSLNILDGDAEPLQLDDAETIGGSSFQPSNPEAIGDGDFDTLT